jgi:hypothetical protein
VCPGVFGLDELEAVVEEVQLVRCRRKARQLVAAGVDVGAEAGGGKLLGQGHAAYGGVLLEDRDVQPGLGEIAGTGQPVVARADDHRVSHSR